jgi:hypothetical protein
MLSSASEPVETWDDSHLANLAPGTLSEDGWFYSCLENESCLSVSKKFALNQSKLLGLNQGRYKGLLLAAKLYAYTILQLPRQIAHTRAGAVENMGHTPEPMLVRRQVQTSEARPDTKEKKKKKTKKKDSGAYNARSLKPSPPYITFSYRIRDILKRKLSPTEVGKLWRSDEHRDIRRECEALYQKTLEEYLIKKKQRELTHGPPPAPPKRVRPNPVLPSAKRARKKNVEAEGTAPPSVGSTSLDPNSIGESLMLTSNDWLEVTVCGELVHCRGRGTIEAGKVDTVVYLPQTFVDHSVGNLSLMTIQATASFDFNPARLRSLNPSNGDPLCSHGDSPREIMTCPAFMAGANLYNGRPAIIITACGNRWDITEDLHFHLNVTNKINVSL